MAKSLFFVPLLLLGVVTVARAHGPQEYAKLQVEFEREIRHALATKDYSRLHGGEYIPHDVPTPECPKHEVPLDGIPENFDARDSQDWFYCSATLSKIREQGYCASCWAVAVSSMLTDRYCIQSQGKENFYFSEQDVLNCASNAASWGRVICKGQGAQRECSLSDSGCDGGNVPRLLRLLSGIDEDGKDKAPLGIVSGGFFRSGEGCLPYKIPPCNHSIPLNADNTPGKCRWPSVAQKFTCDQRCSNVNYGVEYPEDKRVIAQDSVCQFKYDKTRYEDFVQQVQLEIMNNGPVVGVFLLQNNLDTFKPKNENDVYMTDPAGSSSMTHAVKIIGWGTSPYVKNKYLPSGGGPVRYWLISNSFGEIWGDRGVFKIFNNSTDRSLNGKINERIFAATPFVQWDGSFAAIKKGFNNFPIFTPEGLTN